MIIDVLLHFCKKKIYSPVYLVGASTVDVMQSFAYITVWSHCCQNSGSFCEGILILATAPRPCVRIVLGCWLAVNGFFWWGQREYCERKGEGKNGK